MTWTLECVVCEAPIDIATFMHSGVCSEICRVVLTGEK